MKPSLRLLIPIFCGSLLCAWSGGQEPPREPSGTPAPERPWNVLWIISDDLRANLGCYGSEEARTPHLDRLADGSLVFDRAYTQYPVCNPSRSSFLTGWRPDRLGIFNNETQVRRAFPAVITLPQLFRQHGYATAGIGKVFHAGLDARGDWAFFQDDPSFEHFANYLRSTTQLGRKGEGRNLTGGLYSWCQWKAAEGSDLDQPDGQAAAEAIRWLQGAGDRPFFLAVGFLRPHDPFIAPRAYFDLFPPESIALHRPPADRTPDLPHTLGEFKIAFDRFTDQERLEFKRAYLASTAFMDAQVGKLLESLETLGLADRTLVLFTSDHGYHLGEHDWWSKFTLFELCARVPLMLRVPGRTGSGARTSALVELLDLYPTLADLCGLPPPPSGLDGRSFAHLLDDPSRPARDAAFTQMKRGPIMGRSVRTDRWRYTEWDFGRQGAELYAHPDDPLEYHNLAGRPELAEHQAALRARLDLAFPRP